MTERLQKKCFIASAGLHLTLLMVFLFGSAFLGGAQKTKELPELTFIPESLVADNVQGGGSRDAKPPSLGPTPPPPQQQRSESTPPAPKPPVKVEKVEEPKPTVKDRTSDSDALEVKSEKKQHKVQVNLKPVARNTNTKPKPNASTAAEDEARAQAQAKAEARARAQVYGNAARSLRDVLSSGTSITMPGPGGDGPTYAGYAMEVQRICKQRYDAALLAAGDVASEQTSLEVALVLARDGTVLSAKLTAPSPNSTLNRLVLNKVLVAKFPSFPEGSKDSQQTFNVVFDLKPKKAVG
jgi:outer membrane biosynthesis protein TonB